MTSATGIDHLVYASSSLQRGMDEIEQLFGVKPVRGGQHPQYGTHNAQLSLGAGTYLEIIARDPGLPLPEQGAFIDLPVGSDSRLVTWVYRVADIDESSKAVRSAGIELGPVQSGSRRKPDGNVISWQLTDPYAMPLDGAIPFLINWGQTAHPSEAAPSAGQLVELLIEHPDADRVRRVLSALGAKVEVAAGDQFAISARVETKTGFITIQ